MACSVNDSPLAGKEGTKLTSTQLRQRLFNELESNVTLQIKETNREGALEVMGRGELQLAVLIENMRREGFELSVSPPKVLFRYEDGEELEPLEEVPLSLAFAPLDQLFKIVCCYSFINRLQLM